MSSSGENSKLDDEFKKLRATINRPNILLAGCTGAGKTSLINNIFKKDMAKVGVGKPITQKIERFCDENSKVVIFDSKGYEIGSEQEKCFMDDVIDLCEKIGTDSDKIHVVWYCIQSPGARITDFDIKSIKRVQETKTPIAIVLTKSDLVSESDGQALMQVIIKELPGVSCFEVTTNEDLTNDEIKSLQSNLDNLVAWTTDQLPESLRMAFIAEQQRDLESKRNEARKVVHQHAVGAFGIGFSPIPGSDAPLLLANQYLLLARVLYIFGMEGDKDRYSAIIKVIMANILPTMGKWTVAQALKFIPGFGTIIGGLIDASVATSLTLAFGYATVETAFYARQNSLDEFINSDDNKAVSAVIVDVFNKAFNKELQGHM